MEQAGPPRLFFIEPQLRSHHATDISGLNGMHQNILAVTVAVLEHTNQLDDLRMEAVYAKFEHRTLSRLAHRFFDLLLGLLDNFFNPARGNAPVRNQPLKCNASNLSPNWAVARYQYRFRRVIYNQVYPSGGFNRTNITPLTSHNTAFHFVAGQVEGIRSPFRNKLTGKTLNCHTNDFFGTPLSFFAGLLFYRHDLASSVLTSGVEHLFR